MAVPDPIFSALAKSHKGVALSNTKGVQTFAVEGQAFAVLQGKGSGALKLGAPQHAALLEFCPEALDKAQMDGWTQVDLRQMDIALLADYIGAAYRNVAPKVRLAL